MANDFTGRIWRIEAAGITPNGSQNVKIRGGVWTDAAGKTFIITDSAGRAYTWTIPPDGDTINFQELGWLSGPLHFSGTFVAPVLLYLGSK